MPAFLVKDLPPVLHERLKQEATRHHRSMNREVISILEKELGDITPVDVPCPTVPSKPLTAEWVRETTRKMRDRR